MLIIKTDVKLIETIIRTIEIKTHEAYEIGLVKLYVFKLCANMLEYFRTYTLLEFCEIKSMDQNIT